MQRLVVLAGLAVVLLFGFMFVCSVRPTPGYAENLAELAPADSYLFVAADKRGQLDLNGILKDIESGLSSEEQKNWDIFLRTWARP